MNESFTATVPSVIERKKELVPSARELYDTLKTGPKFDELISRYVDGDRFSDDENDAFFTFLEEQALIAPDVSSTNFGAQWKKLWTSDKFLSFAKGVQTKWSTPEKQSSKNWAGIKYSLLSTRLESMIKKAEEMGELWKKELARSER
jgi:hypothetical protein